MHIVPTLVACALLAPALRAAAPDFASEVRPLLERHCFKCHGPEKQKGGLRFDSKEGAFATGDSGEKAIIPGHASKSRLIKLVTSSDSDARMPPKGDGLPTAQIELLKRWIDAGANWAGPATAARSEMSVTDDDRNHWAYRPLANPTPPKVKNARAVRTPVDRFILERLEKARLSPAPPAPGRVLVRRIYFGLAGLPPTPAQAAQFTDAHARDPKTAVASLVDDLLASPHYGERWARHWLDVARYADSDGQEGDADRPTAHHYRDFVIQSLNEDIPFNTFAKWQLAGDELDAENPRAIAATGFIAAGTHAALPNNLMEEERTRTRFNELDDMIATTGSAMLGLTLACSRCHDHKYDPIPRRDYYRMLSAFNSGDRAEIALAPLDEARRNRDALAKWKGELDAAKKAKDTNEIKAVEARKPKALPTAFGFADFSGQPRENFLLARGDFRSKGEPAPLGFLTALTRGKSPEEYWASAQAHARRPDSTHQRSALAAWLADTEHGAGNLLARVIVNRVWQHHFGEGLVRTVNDFGVRADPPTHPALLEYLASEFVKGGWKLKPLHRLIMNSAAYLQDGSFDEKKSAVDPDNRLLWRKRPQRIEAEILRDSMLATSGALNLEMFGPAVKAPIPAEAIQARNMKDPYPKNLKENNASRRRSIYLFHKRVVQQPFMQAFDGPDAQASCGRRDNTTVAPQALALLNDRFVRARAIDFAGRISKSEEPIREAWRLALARDPSGRELESATAFVAAQVQRRGGEPDLALADLCQVIFAMNEFIYVD